MRRRRKEGRKEGRPSVQGANRTEMARSLLKKVTKDEELAVEVAGKGKKDDDRQ